MKESKKTMRSTMLSPLTHERPNFIVYACDGSLSPTQTEIDGFKCAGELTDGHAHREYSFSPGAYYSQLAHICVSA